MPHHVDEDSPDPTLQSGVRSLDTGRVIVVANRGPLREGRAGWQRSPGGLVTALDPVLRERGGAWVSGDPVPEGAALPELGYSLPAAKLSPDIKRAFYEDFSNAVLWPVLHGFAATMPLAEAPHDAYTKANEAFANEALACAGERDLFWVQDYHLMQVPALLRAHRPSARIGWFCHVPWPGPEHFSMLPWRKQLVEGLIAADVIGFHTPRYAESFLACVQQLTHAEVDLEQGTITSAHGKCHVRVAPIGIPTEHIEALVDSPETHESQAALRADVGDRAVVLGVDRLDYTKGIPQRLKAFERLLERDPDWVERAVLVQLVVPSREGVQAYADLRDEIERLVGHINGRFGRPGCMPVQYLYRSLSPAELYGFYRAADVALVTPLRDGMNLVAQEYVFAQDAGKGTLILSEQAGAACYLKDALLVNPYDIDAVADRLQEALSQPSSRRGGRMQSLRAQVSKLDVHAWANGFLGELKAARREETLSLELEGTKRPA